MASSRAASEHSQRRSVILGTAGHIDHGKTALVRALTGIDTDRLPEEKRRGITIDLGFASLETQAPDGSALCLSFIDVPGHARFVRNMLAGAGGVDAVLLVISAEEGVKPQTEEHLAICTLLGIDRGITVVTKCDAVTEERLQDVTRSLRNFLNDTFLAAAPLIATSAYTGFGIEELRSETLRMAASIPARSRSMVVRLPIDRSFVMKGFGTVITGTLIAGSIRTGDELAVEPGGRITKARGIQVHGHMEEEAQAGSRVALNLMRIETQDLERGDTLVAPDAVASVDTIDVELSVLHNAPPLKHRARVHFHAFASECIATATLYDAPRVEAGEARLARLRLARPVVLLPGDRFVLRHGSPITTIGGGRVLDTHPLIRTRKTKTAEWLRRLNAASSEERVWLRIARRGVSGISIKQLSSETGLTCSVLDSLVGEWVSNGQAHIAGDRRVLTQESFSAAKDAILRLLRERSGSDSTGIKRSQLKEQTALEADVFDAALQMMKQSGQLRIDDEFVAPFGAAPVTERDRKLLSVIAREYERAGVTPPSPEEAGERLGIVATEMRRLITLLLRDRTLVRLGSDSLCMDRRVLEELTNRVRALRGQRLDVTVFKQLAGVSRKYAIPLLEYLDRERVTIRQGDQRLVL